MAKVAAGAGEEGDAEGADGDGAEPPELEAESEEGEGEESSISLSAMEAQLKPGMLAIFDAVAEAHKKIAKAQEQRITALVKGAELPRATERRYQKCKDEIIELLKQVRFNNTRLEHLVEQLYELNRRLVTEEGRLLRRGRKRRGQAGRFSAAIHGQRAGGRLAGAGRRAARPRLGPLRRALRRGREAPRRDRADRDGSKAADRRVPPRRADRAARRARGEPRQEGDGRGQSAARHLDREEIHESRPAIPRPDPGRQYRADEGGR